MSWMRLLAVSRSIRPIGYQASRYRIMTQPLAKLSGRPVDRRAVSEVPRVPARIETPEDSGQTVEDTSQRKVTQAPAKAGRTIGMFRIFKKIFFGKDPKMKVVDAGPCLASPQTFDVPPQAYPRGRWTVFRNPFVKRGKSVEVVAPVQGELLLDLVKPVRNDLSDSDLEVVASRETKVVKAQAAEETAPALTPEPMRVPPVIPPRGDFAPETAQADWERVKDQFSRFSSLEKL